MTRQELRDKFDNLGLNYSKVKKQDVINLCGIINKKLKAFNNNGFSMKLRCLRQSDFEYRLNGSVKKMHIMARGTIQSEPKNIIHFKRREAISFNTENKEGIGFIGFAGWADDKNVKPFIEGFDEWLDIYYS